MNLTFTGIGSAFNCEFGNNSCYFLHNENFFLIDCGSLVFQKMKVIEAFNAKDKKCIVLITHLHPDHVASLPELIFYNFFIKNIKTTIIFPNKDLLWKLLVTMGVSEEMVIMEDSKSLQFKEISLEFISVLHSENMESYGLLIDDGNEKIWYSGDSKNIPDEILEGFLSRNISKLYQDISGIDFPGNPHLYYKILLELIPLELREFVYAMHLDSFTTKDLSIFRDEGLNVVEIKEQV